MMAKRICGKRLPSGGVCTRPAGCRIVHVASKAAPLPAITSSIEVALREGPTTIDSIGVKYWCDEAGALHRDGDRPAVEQPNGTKEWFRHGTRHRENDQPGLITQDGRLRWGSLSPAVGPGHVRVPRR